MGVDMNLLKELRALTHAPLKDCKAVLEESNGDLDLAQELLRKKGVLKAAKKADRETNQGVVKFLSQDDVVVGVKLLCETDFVAKNEKFAAMVDDLLSRLLEANGEFTTETVDAELKESMDMYVKERVGTIGENMNLAFVFRTEKKGFVYNHTGNSISSVVFYQSEGDVDAQAKDVALQVAAMNPTYVSMEDVPAEKRQAMFDEYSAELADSNKPEDIKQKIVEGRVFKYFQDDVLLEQASIKDGSKKVKEVVGTTMNITEIMRVTVG